MGERPRFSLNGPTRKQLEFIEEIEGYVDDVFEGGTRREASDWIESHIDEYQMLKAMENPYQFGND